MKEFKRSDLIEIVNKQFEIAGHTDITFEKAKELSNQQKELEKQLEGDLSKESREDIIEQIDKLTWFRIYTTTSKKEEEFKKRLVKYLVKFTDKDAAEIEASILILNYGLMVKDN